MTLDFLFASKKNAQNRSADEGRNKIYGIPISKAWMERPSVQVPTADTVAKNIQKQVSKYFGKSTVHRGRSAIPYKSSNY